MQLKPEITSKEIEELHELHEFLSKLDDEQIKNLLQVAREPKIIDMVNAYKTSSTLVRWLVSISLSIIAIFGAWKILAEFRVPGN